MAGQNRSGSRKQSGKVAFCGMMVALSVALMLTGGLVPIATYCAPMLGVKEAARCMGKSDQFVRIGLQRGLLPFGNAVPGTGACWNYYINPTKFRDYVGADQFNSFFGLTA